MSKRNSKKSEQVSSGVVATGSGSEVVADGLGEILAAQSKEALEGLRTKLRLAKLAKKDNAFYEKYPHVVRDSIRQATEEERGQGLGVHGRVCLVTLTDGSTRLVATQDAFQVRTAKKPKGVARTQATIARLQAELAEMGASEEIAS